MGDEPRERGQICMTDNEEKRLQSIREKMAKMKKQEQSIINRDKERQRKERTRRLIQNGALAEKYLQCERIEPSEFEKKLKEISRILNVADNSGNARGSDRLERNSGYPK